MAQEQHERMQTSPSAAPVTHLLLLKRALGLLVHGGSDEGME